MRSASDFPLAWGVSTLISWLPYQEVIESATIVWPMMILEALNLEGGIQMGGVPPLVAYIWAGAFWNICIWSPSLFFRKNAKKKKTDCLALIDNNVISNAIDIIISAASGEIAVNMIPEAAYSKFMILCRKCLPRKCLPIKWF